MHRKSLLGLCLLALSLQSHLTAQQQFNLPQIADGRFTGGSIKTTFIFFNNGSENTQVSLQLFDDAGEALATDIPGLGSGSLFEFTLPSGETRFFETAAQGDLTVGSARVTSQSEIGVSAVFTILDTQGAFLTEAGIGASSPLERFVIAVDSTQDFSTGLALQNLADEAVTASFQLFGQQGDPMGRAELQLPANGHAARFVRELFLDLPLPFKGKMTVASPRPMAALTLRQNGDPLSFTTLPAVSADSEQTEFVLPQVANGGQAFKTTFVFFNLRPQEVSLQLSLTNDDGEAFPVTLAGGENGSDFNFSLPGDGSLFIETDPAAGPLTAGAARVSSDGPLGVSAIFTVVTAEGDFRTEAGVGDSAELSRFTLPVDLTGVFNTGLAFFNNSNSPTQVLLSLVDAEGGPAQTADPVLLGPLQHQARFVTELFDAAAVTRGSLSVTASGPISALTLRQNDPPLNFTSLPVAFDFQSGALDFLESHRDKDGGIDGLDAPKKVAASPDGRHVYVAASADSAVAVFERDGQSGTLTFVEARKNGVGGVAGLAGASWVDVSSDGRHVYVTGEDEDALAVFERDPQSGALTFLTALRNGRDGIEMLEQPSWALLSPDGRHLYASSRSGVVTVFDRDEQDGSLAFLESRFEGQAGLGGSNSAAFSPDGRFLYVSGRSDDAVSVLERDSASGSLTFRQALFDGQNGAEGLAGATSVAVSPDGSQVFAVGNQDDALAIFQRNAQSGLLTFDSAIVDGAEGVEGLRSASAVALSPDGANVYVASSGDNAVATFRRDVQSGAVTFAQSLIDNQDGVEGLEGACSILVSPDGSSLYAASLRDDSLVTFDRDGESSGSLTFRNSLSDGQGGVDGVNGAGGVAVSPDGLHLYAAGATVDAVPTLAVFDRSQESGRLSFRQAHREEEGGISSPENTVSSLVSPDGADVFLVSSLNSSISVFRRDSQSGDLTFLERHRHGVDGIEGLQGARSAAISADGRHLYVAASDSGTLALFERSSQTGALTFVESLTSSQDLAALQGVRAAAISPDGEFLYAAAATSRSLVSFQRDTSTGQLTQIQQLVDDVDGVRGLEAAWALALSPDGRHLYAAGRVDDAVSVFARDDQSGELAFVESLQGRGLDGVEAVAVSPDGLHVYLAASRDNAIAVLERDSQSGRLSWLQAVFDGRDGVTGLRFVSSLAISPEGGFVYTAGDSEKVFTFVLPGGAVSSFQRRLQ